MRVQAKTRSLFEFELDFSAATRAYYQKYNEIGKILNDNSEILGVFHKELSEFEFRGRRLRRRMSGFTSENFLRAFIVMQVEGLSFRATEIQINVNSILRQFVGLLDSDVMHHTYLQKAFKAIGEQTWKLMNDLLGSHALEEGRIEGEQLRVDTTVYESDVHFPTDESLLWDCYRVIARSIEDLREVAPELVGNKRLQLRRAKRCYTRIARLSSKTPSAKKAKKRHYRRLLELISKLLAWIQGIILGLEWRIAHGADEPKLAAVLNVTLDQLRSSAPLAEKVIDQTDRRVFQEEQVPNDEKIFSIFETHTELIKRGKAGKIFELGHMILLQEVENHFISSYDVFERRPQDAKLLIPIVESHRELFGSPPKKLAADKGFYPGEEELEKIRKLVRHVSIAKKGKRTSEETEREHDPIFRQLQKFRAGIEGTISVLKRAFKLGRCLYRGYRTFASSVGSIIFAHNLVVLARE